MKAAKRRKAGIGIRDSGAGKSDEREASSSAPVLIDRRLVPIDAIHVPADNFRRGDHDGKAIEGLMASMRSAGQQLPIRLRPWNQTGTWSMVFGFRRLEAARRLGWAEIVADCHATPITDREVFMIRAIENLHRLDLDPVEEAAAVCQLLESVTGRASFAPGAMDAHETVDVPASAIQEVAAMLARSQTWVRERIIFARLSPKVRESLASGRLPLGHARELAKLADPKAQEELLDYFERREDGSGGRDLEYCKRCVAERLRTLKGTKFRVDVAWAGKRDCLSCPHNSAQAHSLFTTGGESELADARCLDGACYEVKFEAAERAVQKAVETAQDRQIPTTKLGLAMVATEGLKLAVVERAILRARGELPGGKAGTGIRDSGAAETAERKHNAAVDDWQETATRAVLKKAIKSPESLAALLLGCEFYNMFNKWDGSEATSDAMLKAEPILDLIGKTDEKSRPTLTLRLMAVYVLAKRLARETTGVPQQIDSLHPALVAEIARRWQIKLPPIPGSEAAAATKVRTCRVCGCTENMACIDKKTGQPCRWVAKDLCSACKGKKAKKRVTR
jgi:hypothetical protein